MFYPKRIQVQGEDFHRESASRKFSGEDIQDLLVRDLLQQWQLIGDNGTSVDLYNENGRKLLQHLMYSNAKICMIHHATICVASGYVAASCTRDQRLP